MDYLDYTQGYDLSNEIPIKKWQARKEKNKKVVTESKQKIQNTFNEEIGLLVDIPNRGFANTNDGYTSRRFFFEPQTSCRITGDHIQVIKK